MNREEYGLFRILEPYVRALPNGQRLFSQVAIEEIIYPTPKDGQDDTRKEARKHYAAKRLDFLIIDNSGFPVLAIEYQGTGHYQGNARFRDEVKRRVLTDAGIPVLEVPAHQPWPTTERALRGQLFATGPHSPSRAARVSALPAT